MATKTIALFAPPGVQLTDVSGPLDVFAEANAQTGRDVYRLEVIGTVPGPIRSSSGVRLLADRTIGTSGSSHTLLVAGAPNLPDLKPAAGLVDWLRAEAKRSRRYGSVCSGAFLLAATGLLAERRVTTHWAVADRLAREYPTLAVEKDALYVRDGPVRTAAGVTAGMDLSIALVEEDLGKDVAMRVAAQLVMFFRRPGGQLQFSRDGVTAPAGRSALQELQRYVAAHPAEGHAVPQLAARVGLSTRHFARLFASEVGVTPATWVEVARVEAARGMLEAADGVPKVVAQRCGFADVDVLRRAFQRHVGVTPAEYRRRFRRE
ncbi:GlxA family transcriptional regulator [Limnoglobus roseus]|uniref:GlxA family transcriptional regulator n=1 Tax=Limnoglobus roseus TaxID=2598579 RepID=A0A5C1AL24_9BACT|nr:helix-turn-helix domain-containing protein [Limnoglobus roseus]QEL18887.1 GlxA family transcriptional regulator [Limnoglobus roseus]